MTTAYRFDNRTDPPTVLPADLNPDDMLDMTIPGEPFRVLLDRTTGIIHNGARYAAEMRKLIEESAK